MRAPNEPSASRTISRLYKKSRQLERRTNGPWHNIGGDGEPAFVTGRNQDPTELVPNPVPLRYRMGLTGIEIQGDVAEVGPGDIVFYFPLSWWPDHDLPVDSHDDAGVYVPCRIRASDGAFLYGVA